MTPIVCARIVDAARDQRPAVVLAFLDDVQLVAAARAVIVLPQTAGSRIERQPFGAAHAVRPDLGKDARLADERIVGRRRPIRRDANDLAEVVVELLRDVPRRRIRTVAERHQQIAVGRDHDSAAGLRAQPFRRHDRQCAEDDGDVGQRERLLIEACPRDTRIGVRAVDVIEEAEKDALVAGEVRDRARHRAGRCLWRRAAATTDAPASGPDTVPSVRRMRILPGSLSVRMMLPLGRNARLHGTSRLSMRVVTL